MSGEKTEKPTPRRQRESRKKGELARSRMFASAVVTLGGLLGARAAAPAASERLKAWTARLFVEQDLPPVPALVEAGRMGLAFVVPCLVGAFLAALGLSVAVAGLRFEPGLVAPKVERVSLAKGLSRLFALGNLAEVGKGLLAVGVLGVLGYAEAKAWAPALFRSVRHGEGVGFGVALEGLGALAVRCAGVLALLGLGDYLLARRRHLRSLMMSREEVKREHKNSEGDPHHKAKRRAAHRQLGAGGPARGVSSATAVVVNPTHLAVALRYEPGECEAPYLVAKGREADARALRLEAERLGIPIVRDVPLARSLIHYDVGEDIPEELYRAAAAVLQAAMDSRERPRAPGRRLG
ncbi:MAG TPA: EscU/YscU/HrcU family type III secretion system export apparatus switch protein [Myxococcaceae bacterium]|nr:EscU/YscU/HrcU family type III secretion system export apparatus switch protein [Myxococcaceae bacterium]